MANARKFYEKMWRLTEDFKTRAFLFRNQEGNLVTDTQSILSLLREHFSNLLNGSEITIPGDGWTETPIDDDEIDIPISDYDEVWKKYNKVVEADGLTA